MGEKLTMSNGGKVGSRKEEGGMGEKVGMRNEEWEKK